MRKAIDLGPVEAAAIKTAGGKIRLRLLLSADQLESMLIAARAHDPPAPQHVTQCDASVTQCDAPEKTQIRSEDDDEDDAREAPLPPTAPVGRSGPVFVYQATRAWAAWIAFGHDPSLCVRREHEGRVRTGWHFPSLFPPTAAQSTGPPNTLMTEADHKEVAERGL